MNQAELDLKVRDGIDSLLRKNESMEWCCEMHKNDFGNAIKEVKTRYMLEGEKAGMADLCLKRVQALHRAIDVISVLKVLKEDKHTTSRINVGHIGEA